MRAALRSIVEGLGRGAGRLVRERRGGKSREGSRGEKRRIEGVDHQDLLLNEELKE